MPCNNQVYFIKIERTKKVDWDFYTRQVISIGWIFRGYGRSIDIPVSRWTLDNY